VLTGTAQAETGSRPLAVSRVAFARGSGGVSCASGALDGRWDPRDLLL